MKDDGGLFGDDRLIAKLVSYGIAAIVAAALLLAPLLAMAQAPAAALGFNEGSGTTSADLTGNGHTATLGAGPTWTTTGRYSAGLLFSGATIAAVSVAGALDLGNSFSAMLWVKRGALGGGQRHLLSKCGASWQLGCKEFYFAGDVLRFGSFSTGDMTLGTIADTNWHHLAVVFNRTGNVMQFYQDGALITSGSKALEADAAGTTVTIGNHLGANPFNGVLDEFRFYQRVATAAEVAVAMTTPLVEPACLPGNFMFKGTGTDYQVFETADMHGVVGWCPSASGGWYIAVHQWCLRAQCDKAPADAWTKFTGAIERVRAASEPMTQLRAEWKTYGVPLATDLERWQYWDWRYQACQWLTSTQPGVTPRPAMPIAITPPPANADGSLWVPPLNYCDASNPGPRPSTPCAAQQVGWTQGTASCDAAYAGGAAGSSTALSDVVAPSIGTATATCTNGNVVLTQPLCSVPPPPAVQWVVTPDGTKAERQWFLAVQNPDGTWKRSTTPSGTTPVGGACDCAAISFKEFNITTYCKVAVPNAANPVAACMVKK